MIKNKILIRNQTDLPIFGRSVVLNGEYYAYSKITLKDLKKKEKKKNIIKSFLNFPFHDLILTISFLFFLAFWPSFLWP